MNDDVLRDRLIALDPDAGALTDPVTSDRARALLETIMSTPTSTPNHPDRTTDRPDTGGHESTVVAMRRTVGRRWMVTFAGVAAAAVAGATTFVAVRGGDEPVTTSTFSLASSDPLTQMCLPFDPTLLAAVPVAFAGTVTDITTDDTGTNVVRIETDRWYRGPTRPMWSRNPPCRPGSPRHSMESTSSPASATWSASPTASSPAAG